MDLLIWSLALAVGLNLLMFILAFQFNTDKLTDLSYSITFIILALVGYSRSTRSLAQSILLVMVLVWAFRLGTFLFIRVNKVGKDSRFDEMRSKFWSFFRFWFFQGLTVFIVLIGGLLFWKGAATQVGWLSYLGLAVYGLGLLIEAFADWQKYTFNQTKTTDTWIDKGVWRISRHPNYLGEILVWLGIYLFIFSSLSSVSRLVAALSPIYIASILLFFSGIPLLERSADKKWGSNAGYIKYKISVPLLIPNWRSIKRVFG